jgi:Amt family ammonium transporter
VHLVAAGVALAALVVWVPRRAPRNVHEPALMPAQLPLLAVVGSLLILVGSFGWMWANPLQMNVLSEVALMRGSVNLILFAGGGIVVPLFYTWFVTGKSEPLMSARGLAAGVVAGMAVGPFVQPGQAFVIGFLAGATVPFVTYLVDGLLRLDDVTGSISISGMPALVGLLSVGIFADGTVGQGWHMTGLGNYLGVTGQGVTGLFAASGFQPDFPGQLQAQVIGILSLILWGFSAGMLVCAPLGLLLHSLLRGATAPMPNQASAMSAPLPPPHATPLVGEQEVEAFVPETPPVTPPPTGRPFAPRRSPFS